MIRRTPRVPAHLRAASRRHVSTHPCEPLESRILLANLFGREWYRVTNVVIPGDPVSVASTVLTKLYDLSTDATITAQVSQIHNLISGQLGADVDLEIFTESRHVSSEQSGDSDELITVGAPAGSLQVSASTGSPLLQQSCVVAIAADRAPGGFVSGSNTDFRTDIGRDMGTLSTNETELALDFVGYLDTIAHVGQDLVDTYFFDIPKSGSVRTRLSDLEDDPAGGTVKAKVAIYRDFDSDGRLEASEVLHSGTADANTDQDFTQDLNAGRYAVVVSRLGPFGSESVGGSNYHLRLNYSVPDDAGNSISAARNIGALGGNTQSFADYLAADDTADFYKFTTPTGQGGPFRFDGTLAVSSSFGADFDLDFIRDANNNGTVDGGDVIASGTNHGFSGEDITVFFAAPGTYFARVRRVGGEAPYTLNMKNSNTDLAGNTLDHALNISRLFGRKFLTDSISGTDTVDLIKFNLPAAGTFRASFPATAAGTDADLALLDQNGAVLSTNSVVGNGGESLSRVCNPGDYFVRLSRVTGTPAYNLTMSIDTAGSTPATALALPTSGVNAGTTEFVGAEDTTDFYRFDLTSSVQFNVFLKGTFDSVLLDIARDSNGNGLVDTGESFLKKTVGTVQDRTSFNATPGRYFVKVSRAGAAETNYLIDLRTLPTDNAGDDLKAARNIGVLGSAVRTFNDFIGHGADPVLTDLDDYYKFTYGNNGPFSFSATVSVSGVSGTGSPGYELIRDDNLNDKVDLGEVVATRTGAPGAGPPPTSILETVPGTYFLHVTRFGKEVNFNYTLTTTAPSLDEAGNTLATARDDGALSTQLGIGAFVGEIDKDDFWRFSINAPSELSASLLDVDAPEVFIEIIRDANNNSAIDPGETLANTVDSLTSNDSLNGLFLPVAGNYFARVTSRGADANYRLILTRSSQTPFTQPFQINNTGPTKIEAENYDNGGESVAYHDTTAGNDGTGTIRLNEGVDLRPTTDAGGGFRLATTAAGEFTEYSIFVNQTAQYDVDFRVASPGNAARFHAEVDGTSITGPFTLPNTGNVDSMVTLTQASVLLTAGPHILRLAMDATTGGNPNIAGTYNFITIRPAANPTGTFLATPQTVRADRHGQAIVSLLWTVPSGSWRGLKDIEIRLLDRHGEIIRIKFDEAANTLSIFDQRTQQYGEGKTPGSDGKLKSGGVTLNLAGSRFFATGPTSSSVTLGLDLQFKRPLRDRHFTIEAAATDDSGHRQDFAFAGFLDT